MRIFITLFIFLIIVACGSVKNTFYPVESDLTKVNSPGSIVTLEELNKGYNLYVASCAGCHWLPVPTKKNKSDWEQVFPEMFLKAKLTPDQQQLIRHYVFSKL
ncbi:MAG: hypothetical protein NT126_02225 [Bacteroidetes bacterium]|nr:hypothetical protein [Bacteroidota bacterium]